MQTLTEKPLISYEAEQLYNRIHSICKGEANAQKESILAEWFGWSERKVRALCQELREHNYLIAYSDKGLYYPESKTEAWHFYERQIRSRIRTLLREGRGIKLAIEREYGNNLF